MPRKLFGLLLAALAFGAPVEDAPKELRIAYASQYEWKEDGVENATLEFRYTWVTGTKGDVRLTGTGHIVIVDGEIVRWHLPDVAEKRSEKENRILKWSEDPVAPHVRWVLGRFIRDPFEKAFEEAKFGKPVDSAYGSKKYPVDDLAHYVKDGRLIASDVQEGDKKPITTRVEFTTKDLGDGYAILGERMSFTRRRDGLKVDRGRTLTTKVVKEIPAPSMYTYAEKTTRWKSELTIEFSGIKFNQEHAVVLDPAARDLLKAAWERRYTLPDSLRISGEFQRKLDRDLDRGGWTSEVRGDFQIWELGKLDEKLQVALADRTRGRQEVEKTCTRHLHWIFNLLRARDFDEEFKGCGFEQEPQGKEIAIRVYGYQPALAYKLVGDEVVGMYNRILSESGWWEIKSKAQRDGAFLPDRMKRTVEGRKLELKFKYQRSKGLQIPKKMDVFAQSGTTFGVCNYTFKRQKVKE